MPIYAYKCESCGFAKDVLQKMSDSQLTECPTCGAAAFKKQLTAAGFQLKGSGWYATDFKGSAAPAGAAADASAPAKPAADGAAQTAAPAKADAPAASATGGCGGGCACH
ncbi:MAG: zinc ribbon domain-containing protein [Comamonadaceae bacterium]|jgi:putative FmdB family regulatory protein|nr:zinc ribbon domain-containing protein [Rhodoferax sp.]TSA06897.1 MAG: zinc ribbon domain-containing protein [Comamonadaceae bacterium]